MFRLPHAASLRLLEWKRRSLLHIQLPRRHNRFSEAFQHRCNPYLLVCHQQPRGIRGLALSFPVFHDTGGNNRGRIIVDSHMRLRHTTQTL